jgi:predicted MPP superfamily phosphohydrolase
MKTVSIGDTHGAEVADVVSKIIDLHDKFIFIGDYVDSFFFDNATITKNLLDIIELKKRHPDKIILLWGNHDIQYLPDNTYFCTGYRPEMHPDLSEIFHSNSDQLQFSYQVGDYLWTHAGVNAWWFEHRFNPFIKEHKEIWSVSWAI